MTSAHICELWLTVQVFSAADLAQLFPPNYFADGVVDFGLPKLPHGSLTLQLLILVTSLSIVMRTKIETDLTHSDNDELLAIARVLFAGDLGCFGGVMQ